MNNKKEIKAEYKKLEKEKKALYKKFISIRDKLCEIELKEITDMYNKLSKDKKYYITFGSFLSDKSLTIYKLDDLNGDNRYRCLRFRFSPTYNNRGFDFCIGRYTDSLIAFKDFYKEIKGNYLTGEEFINFKIKAELAVARDDASIVFDYLKNECKHCKID